MSEKKFSKEEMALEIFLRLHPHMNTPDNKCYQTPDRSKTLQALHEMYDTMEELLREELAKAFEWAANDLQETARKLSTPIWIRAKIARFRTKAKDLREGKETNG